MTGPELVRRNGGFICQVRPVAVPVRVRGRQGLFNLPPDAETAVRAQIGQEATA